MKKVLVSLLVGVTLCGGLFGCGSGNTVSQEDYNKVVEENETLVSEKETLVKNNEDLVKDKQELQAKIDSVKDYFELDENEKVLVDQKIEEVNKATEEQKEAEKKAKEEEERAKKEAEEQAEAERKAAEEQAKREEEERIAQEQAALQPYRDATTYVKQIAAGTGYTWNITLDENTKTISMSFDTGDTSVSDLRELGYDDETIKQIGGAEAVYSSCRDVAVSCYSEVASIYGVWDVQIKASVKIGGETVCTFNQNGDCIYSIF